MRKDAAGKPIPIGTAINAQRSFERDSIDLYLRRYSIPEGGKPQDATRELWTEAGWVPYTSLYPGPSLSIGMTGWGGAQELFDELWRMGLRPSDNAHRDETLVATQGHVEDLRKVLYQVLPSALRK